MSLVWVALGLAVLRASGMISTGLAVRLCVTLLASIVVVLAAWGWADQRCIDQLEQLDRPAPAADGPAVWTT